ncbi:hypothetical protein IV203_022403 [Nitzschia inconspicua]|uniref:Uncharacterized protein n=1 Tax=Nitzschia inconspicua TaxID=303405 RepID=A0A9K3PEM2_9STRA|nr:hypothetical protein IV203_022403 [Nitzschia inconspicua]
MKSFLLVCGILLAVTEGLAPPLLPPSKSLTNTRLYGLLDFKPFHGHGSGEQKKDLDDQWAVQQEILAARRGHIDKSALKKKYANGAKGDLSSLGGGTRKSGNSGRQDEMYVESPKATSIEGLKKPKFFWEK